MHVLSSLGVGGMERVVLRLASAQRDAGHHVTILALRGGPLDAEALERGLHATVLHGGRAARSLQSIRFFLGQQADIVHCHNATSLHYAVLSKIVSRPAIVVTMHGNRDTHARLGTRIEWRLTSAVVMVSHAAGDTLDLPEWSGKVSVIHNGIATPGQQTNSREMTRRHLGLGDEVAGVIVARIDGRKGHMTLLDSLSELKRSGAHVRLLVVGDGQERGRVEERAKELCLGPETLVFLGSRTDVDDLLAAADFFVLPSLTEGLPMSALEAMAHGLPVVATRVGGLPELIDDGLQGLLVPAGDAGALAAAIRRVVSDPSIRRKLGDGARERVSAEFSLAAMTARYEALYERSLAGEDAHAR